MEIDQRQKYVCPPSEAGQCGQDDHILVAHGDLREQFRLPSNQRAAVRVSIAHQIYFKGGTFCPTLFARATAAGHRWRLRSSARARRRLNEAGGDAGCYPIEGEHYGTVEGFRVEINRATP